MPKNNYGGFTEEQLFTDLNKDGVLPYEFMISSAEKNKGDERDIIGRLYQEKKQYDKAKAWFQLAAASNNHFALNDIGDLYTKGIGVPRDYISAMEWYLKAASQGSIMAMNNIGKAYECGRGVPVDPYRAQAWYHRGGIGKENIKDLNKEGFRIKKSDSLKSTEKLILEAIDIIWNKRRKQVDKLKEEIETLQAQIKGQGDKIENHQEELKRKQQEIQDKQELVEKCKEKNEKMNSETQTLKMTNAIQLAKLDLKDSYIKSLEHVIASLGRESQIPLHDTTEFMTEIEESNQHLTDLLEQESLVKNDTITQLKQQLEASVNEVQTQKRKWEEDALAMQNELKRLRTSIEHNNSSEKNDISDPVANDDNDVENQDSGHETEHSGNNKDHDTADNADGRIKK